MENKFKEFCEKSGLNPNSDDHHEQYAYLAAKNAWDIQQKENDRLQGVINALDSALGSLARSAN